MTALYRFSCASGSVRVSVSRIDELLLHVVFKRLFRDCYPKEPIKTIAEAEIIQDKSALLMRIFFWAPNDKPKEVPTGPLRRETRDVLEEINRDRDPLFNRYTVACKMTIEQNGQPLEIASSGSGTLSGISLGGSADYTYSIYSNIGECTSDKLILAGPSMGRLFDSVDLRSQSSLMTDNMGTIKIKKKRVSTTLQDELARLLAFVDLCQSETIEISLQPS